MAQATYDPGNPYGTPQPAPALRGWVIALPLVLGIAGAGYYLWPQTNADSDVPMEKNVSAWTLTPKPMTYATATPPVVEQKPETNTDALLKELLADLKAQRAELQALKIQQAQAVAPAAGQARPQRKHASMLFIEHEVPEKPVSTEPLYWLGAGTWVPCQLEPRLNSDVPGFFSVKTRAPIYDTKTGRHLLIKQNQPIVAKDESQALLFGNTRIPTFALTLSNPDGSSVDLGSMPITDQLGTNGLTGKVHNHTWRLIWTSIFIGGLRGGQQAIQAGITPGDPSGAIASNVTGQLSQAGQQRLGRAQDTRPTIEVESGSLCNLLLTKAIQLPEIER